MGEQERELISERKVAPRVIIDTTNYTVDYFIELDKIERRLAKKSESNIGLINLKDTSVHIKSEEVLTATTMMCIQHGGEFTAMKFVSGREDIEKLGDENKFTLVAPTVEPDMDEYVISKLERIISGRTGDGIASSRILKGTVGSEGALKALMLWKLIMAGSIIKGTSLFWDELETSINPKMIRILIEVLFELSRQGVQIFITTNSYALTKYVEITREESDKVAFHSIYKTHEGEVKCETQSKFSHLGHNEILEENIDMYDAEMKKEFK